MTIAGVDARHAPSWKSLRAVFYCDDWGFEHVPASVSSDIESLTTDTAQGPKKKQRNLHSFFQITRVKKSFRKTVMHVCGCC